MFSQIERLIGHKGIEIKILFHYRNQQWRILHNERKFDAVITSEGGR